MLEHGGGLRQAAARYGIPLADWLDLSTGINPVPWPTPALPASSWHRLPETDDGLEAAARAYYQAPALLPVAGSQAAIQALPALRSRSRVGVLQPAYAEHAQAWQRAGQWAGHAVEVLPADSDDALLDAAITRLDVLILIHPNNPTGRRYPLALLRAWHRRLALRGGWLIVDEAFMDATPEYSLAAYSDAPGLIVLRSLGKFFGLAGARVGFVLAAPALLNALNETLGPWTISGPARCLATQALADRSWQAATRQRLARDAQRLHDLLDAHGLTPTGGSALFQWLRHEQAGALQDGLAGQGIWVRRFAEPSSLRFGLPHAEGWHRFARALEHCLCPA